MTIEELLTALKRRDRNAFIYYDFCDCAPADVDSWRGAYSLPAIGWRPPGKTVTVATVMRELINSISRFHSGWKGGTYRFTADQPLHVDNVGESTCTMVVDVVDRRSEVIICTAREEIS